MGAAQKKAYQSESANPCVSKHRRTTPNTQHLLSEQPNIFSVNLEIMNFI